MRGAAHARPVGLAVLGAARSARCVISGRRGEAGEGKGAP